MTTKIKCVILRTNRTIKVLVKNIKTGEFRYNKGLYLMPKQYVSLISDQGVIKEIPELIYYENDPLPINIINRKKMSGSFLDDIVIENVLSTTAKPSSLFFQVIAEYLRNPFKIVMLAFALLIAIVLLNSILTGGFLF